MRIFQIKLNDWMKNERGNPTPLLELPFSVLNVENFLGLSFDEYLENGLGICYSCFIRIDDQEVHLKGFIAKGSKKVGVVVEMHSDEFYPDSLVEKICRLFNMRLHDLKWIREKQ